MSGHVENFEDLGGSWVSVSLSLIIPSMIYSESNLRNKNLCLHVYEKDKIKMRWNEIKFSPRAVNLYDCEDLTLYSDTSGSLASEVHCWERKKRKTLFLFSPLNLRIISLMPRYPQLSHFCYHGNPAPFFVSVKDVRKGGMKYMVFWDVLMTARSKYANNLIYTS